MAGQKAQQDRPWEWVSSVPATLLNAERPYLDRIWAAFARAIEANPLSTLALRSCTALTDLAPLATLTGLQWLDLSGCTALTDLAPLLGLKHLAVFGKPDR